jgi:phage terminase large subunit-like protein
MLVADSEAGCECYGAASDREQAGIIYREAAAMVRASPALSKQLEVIDSRKTILHRRSNSFYRVLSADAFRAEGLNIHALLFDELGCAPRPSGWGARPRKTCTHNATAVYGTHSVTAAPRGSSRFSCPSPRPGLIAGRFAGSSTSTRKGALPIRSSIRRSTR